MADNVIRIGIAGLGTVGSAVVNILEERRTDISAVTGKSIEVVAVSARDKAKKRNINLQKCEWVDDPRAIARRDDIDVVVEAMGGDGDPALTTVRLALERGKAVVTANKALLAHHGHLLATIAKQHSAPLMFEAAVAGGIPIIKMLREGLAANRIDGVYGILNGTCNYILTTMERTGEGFDAVLAAAQKHGYAEADPALDVDGGDTAHKLSLLTALAFRTTPQLGGLDVMGIRNIGIEDIRAAAEFGYRIKLIGQSRRIESGEVLHMVSPSLVPLRSSLAHVDGVLNGILTSGSFAGESFIAGRGAGGSPTASAVVADLMDIARGNAMPHIFMEPVATLSSRKMVSSDSWAGRYYMRMVVDDKPGVIADIAPILRDHKISIESLVQKGRGTEEPVSVIIMTHEANGSDIRGALGQIAALKAVARPPLAMPVLDI
jgi:homoserine dehydrogenase